MTTWHLANVAAWSEVVGPAIDGKPVQMLEVGSYAGSGAAWLLEHLLPEGSRLTCIDTWSDASIEREFDAATASYSEQVTKLRGNSATILPRLVVEGNAYDICYVDADHDASAVLRDTVFCWQMLKLDGLLVLDDYPWRHGKDKVAQLPPGMGVDSFLAAYQLQLSVLHLGNCVVVRKRRESNSDTRYSRR